MDGSKRVTLALAQALFNRADHLGWLKYRSNAQETDLQAQARYYKAAALLLLEPRISGPRGQEAINTLASSTAYGEGSTDYEWSMNMQRLIRSYDERAEDDARADWEESQAENRPDILDGNSATGRINPMSPDLIIRQAVRYLAMMPEHEETKRLIGVCPATALLDAAMKDPLFANIRAIGINYGHEDYPNMGELILKRSKGSSTDKWGISKIDAAGDNMLREDLSWGWVIRMDDFLIFSLLDGLKHCWEYLKTAQVCITSYDIRDTYYAN